MRTFLQWLLRRQLSILAEKISSSPDKKAVEKALSRLLARVRSGHKKKTLRLSFPLHEGKYIIFSDQHKGARDEADDFRGSACNYRDALDHYFQEGFHFINLGDCEELWKYTPEQVLEKNQACLQAEKRFLDRNQYSRVFGNHDLEWKFPFQVNRYLKPVFGSGLKIYEAILLETGYRSRTYSIFLTHGHQGDRRSDGNGLSAWVVAAIWTPIQRYLQISLNTPATSFALTDKHNIIMHDWSAAQSDLLFISGHTHHPVFASMDHMDRLGRDLHQAAATGDQEKVRRIQSALEQKKVTFSGKQAYRAPQKPSYFNTGCCCFSDGDITGIEIEGGHIRLVKWTSGKNKALRQVLEEAPLSAVFDSLRGA